MESSLAAACSSKSKRDAEALAQGEAPGAVDARAEGRVHDELHAARLVEEALEDDVGVGGHEAEGVAGRAEVVDDLARAEVVEAALRPRGGCQQRLAVVEAGLDVAAQAADFLRQLDRAAGRLADPERDRGRRAVGVLDAHLARARRA